MLLPTNPKAIHSLTQKGTYALILEVVSTRQLQVGRLGKLLFKSGFYIYVGSAFGPGGLKARLNHHLKLASKHHWHIDYLRQYANVIEIWYTIDPARREQDWVKSIGSLPTTTTIFPGFGASDSKDVSHLFMAAKKPDFSSFQRVIKSIPDHGCVFVSSVSK